jgi:hypothetical protein
MTDRELLTKAAKAAGYTLDADCDRTDVRDNGGGPLRWNPRTDDGDSIETFEDESQRADLTRLAILQAAAEMADAPGAA